MVQWFIIILAYNLAILELSLSEVTLSLRLLHYKNRNGLTYENRPCDSKIEHDINRDGRCDTAFLFCLVRLPFQNPHNCTLGDHFTGLMGADEIHFVKLDSRQQDRSSMLDNYSKNGMLTASPSSSVSLWFQPMIHFHFKYPKTGIGLIVEVFDIDDANNHSIHDSIDFYGRTLLDLKLYRFEEDVQPQRIFLRSLFGTYTNLTVDFSLYCSPNYYGTDCDVFCLPNEQRYECDPETGQKICRGGHFGQDCLSDLRACEDRPCLNNGTCVVYLHSYLCQCQRGFTGRSCEMGPKGLTAKSGCNENNCIHGDCSRGGKCICHDSWTSDRCNRSLIIDASGCASGPCLHNSTCETLVGVNPGTAYRCHCRSGYTGRNCEIEIVNLCERTPCVHGKCYKIDLFTEICVCERNWSGIDCTQSLAAAGSPSITRYYDPSISLTSAKRIRTSTTRTTTRSAKGITSTTVKADLTEYLNWLNTKYGVNRTLFMSQQVTKSAALDPHKYTPCLSAPCLHNSTCVIQSERAFRCICPATFVGLYCEIELLESNFFPLDPCDSSPCQHQSICVPKSNQGMQCICRPPYKGQFCEYLVPFQPPLLNTTCTRSCRNGGICVIIGANRQQCICKSSHTGSYCEIAKTNCTKNNDSSCINNPCLSSPCSNNGTCYLILPSKNYTCTCKEPYTGDRCESELDDIDVSVGLSRDTNTNAQESSPATTDLWPLAIVFGYVFSLMLVFIIIWFLWYGLTVRPQSYVNSDIPYGERVSNRYQPYRLGVSNPLFFTNQEYSTPISKTFLTPPATISNLGHWTRTMTR